MNWGGDGTSIHPQEILIGDFISNISGMKRFQPFIFVIRRIVGSDINSAFFEWVLLTVILLQDKFNISPVLSFTQKLTVMSSFYKCWWNSREGGEWWDFDVLSWALDLSIFDFEFDFVEMREISFMFLKDERNGEMLENVSRHEHNRL